MQISSKKRSLCIKYALHVFTASTIYSLSFPMLLAVITHYHLRPSMNKARSFPTIHLYDLIYAETSIYASSGFGPLGPKPCGGEKMRDCVSAHGNCHCVSCDNMIYMSFDPRPLDIYAR